MVLYYNEEKFNLSTYKLYVVADVLDSLDELKRAAIRPRSQFLVKALQRKKKSAKRNHNAYFEVLVDRYVDIEKLINSLDEPFQVILRERLFLKETDEVKRRLGLRRKREAEKLVRQAVNKFYHMLENYRKNRFNGNSSAQE